MIAYVISDIHVDYYIPQSKVYLEQEPFFEQFYDKYFLPADVLLLAGDIANDYYTQVGFLRFIACKYRAVYVVNGNHDMHVRGGTTLGNGNPFKTSIARVNKVIEDMAPYGNVHILEGNVVGNIGGCMGFADFMYGFSPGASMYCWEKNIRDSVGWNFKHNCADVISSYYMDMIGDMLTRCPRIMMTHYCPLQLGVPEQYDDDPLTPSFYFDLKQFRQEGTTYPPLWICGHTHTTRDVTWVDDGGETHRILCNPLGYPNNCNDFVDRYNDRHYLIEVDI